MDFAQMEQRFREAAEREKAEEEAAARKAREDAVAAERAKIEADRKAQLEAERANLVPVPESAMLLYRSEISIEQANLFVSNSYKGDWFTYEWTTKHPETGEPITCRRTIGKWNDKDKPRGVLRQFHGAIWRKLLRLWGEQTNPRGEKGYGLRQLEGHYRGAVDMSAYGLVKQLRSSNGEDHYKRVQNLLGDLASIPIVLENFHTWNGYVDRVAFTLLGDVQWIERSVDKKTGLPKPGGESRVKVFFSEFVTEGFLRKHVKMMLGEPGKKLRGNAPRAEFADLLYHFLNGQLATKDEYHVRLTSLAEQFGMIRYPSKSARKRKLVPALSAIHGARILAENEREFFLHVGLRDASDGDDYVLVAHRTKETPPPLVLLGAAQLAIPGIIP